MDLSIEQHVYDGMLVAARKAAPLESCGLCGGNDRRVTRFYELTNADASPEHFSMIPEEQFAAVKDMRAAGLKMIAIWHSHPATPPRMSAEDLRLAFTPDVAYVILSLAAAPPEMGAYTVRDAAPHRVDVIVADKTE